MKSMKYLILLLGVICISLSSCKKDDDPSFEDQVQGVWYITLLEFSNCPDPDDNDTVSLPASCNGQMCLRFTFEDDGVLRAYQKYEQDEEESIGSYSGDEDAFTICAFGDCITGNMEINGDLAILTFLLDDCNVAYTFRR